MNLKLRTTHFGGRRMNRIAIATLGASCAILTAFVSPALAATTATITGANINQAGTEVSVSNVKVSFDSCGGFDPAVGFTGCGAIAGVIPASNICPKNGDGIQELWKQPAAVYASEGPKAFNSGTRTVAVDDPVAHRICAYSYLTNTGGNLISASETPPVLRGDALTPAPTPPAPPEPPVGKISQVSVSGPKRLKKGKFRVFTVKVSNTGDGAATNVVVNVRGKGVRATGSFGDIPASASVSLKVKLRPAKVGRAKLTFKVTSRDAGESTATQSVVVARSRK